MILEWIKNKCPAPVRAAIRPYHPVQVRHRIRTSMLKRRHQVLNNDSNAESTQIVMRQGFALDIAAESREPFEWFCWRAPDIVKEFDSFLSERGQYHRFLDIGAYHGLFSLAFTMQRPEASAIAVEPCSSAQRTLSHNVSLNAGCRVDIANIAVGEAAREIRMRDVGHYLMALPDTDGSDVSWVNVHVERGDVLCEQRGFRPDLCKIDVEGFELDVLRGLSKVLSDERPVLFLEIHPLMLQSLGHSVEDVFAELRCHGYAAFLSSGAPATEAEMMCRGRATSHYFICRPV